MGTTTPKQVKAKKVQVFVNNELTFETNKHEEALTKACELQTEKFPNIKLVNHDQKKTLLFTKGRYDKNYRVTSQPYETVKQEPIPVTEEQ